MKHLHYLVQFMQQTSEVSMQQLEVTYYPLENKNL